MTTSLREPVVGHYWQMRGSRPLKITSIDDSSVNLASDDGRTIASSSVRIFKDFYRYVAGGE